ncbi:hypothetical protein P7C73_g4813, partial [Tremellales sp. Uapishka_1]
MTSARSSNIPTFTAESLSLSASLFTSSIDSWVPKDFGLVKTDEDKRKEFASAFRPGGAERNERLGLGHPLLDAPPPQASSSHSSLSHLSKHLKRGTDAGKDSEAKLSQQEEEDDDGGEEEESRSRSVGRGKARKAPSSMVNPFGKKKKATTTKPSRPSPIPEPLKERSPATTSSPGGSGEFPFQGPLAISHPPSPKTGAEQKRPREEVESEDADEVEGNEVGAGAVEQEDGEKKGDEVVLGRGPSGGKSKTQMRREKRKRKKLASQGSA